MKALIFLTKLSYCKTIMPYYRFVNIYKFFVKNFERIMADSDECWPEFEKMVYFCPNFDNICLNSYKKCPYSVKILQNLSERSCKTFVKISFAKEKCVNNLDYNQW